MRILGPSGEPTARGRGTGVRTRKARGMGLLTVVAWLALFTGCAAAPPAPHAAVGDGATQIRAMHVRPPGKQIPQAVHGGRWDTSHLQGIAVDLDGGHLYFSFTSILVKTDLAGRLLGTVEGIPGHLGDLEFDPGDRMLYGSLDYKQKDAFYVAVFDVDRLSAVGMDAQDLMRTVYLPEVAADYAGGRDAVGGGHRFGTSGIDGVSFGPAFGSTEGPWMLTVAYAIFPSSGGSGDDDQVLLQYDTSGWERFARPLDPHRPHRIGPSSPAGKFFVRTGNTTWGVQNLEYDCASERWLLAVYAGRKPQYPNFTLFAVDAGATPRAGYVPDAEDGRGMRLRLSGDGIRDAATWIRGWRQDASVGLESVGGGVFYLASHSEHAGLQSGDAELVEWAEDSTWPLQPVGHPARAPGCPSGP